MKKMKQVLLAWALLCALCAGMAVPALAAPNIIAISSAEQLLAFGETIVENPEVNGVLMADIDLSGIDWKPLAYGYVYHGQLDGAGYTIYGLTGSGALLNSLGEQGRLCNLNLKDVRIQNGDENHVTSRTAALVSYSKGEIVNCTVSGSISANSNTVGGIVGEINAGAIINCRADMRITYRTTDAVSIGSGVCSLGGVVGEFSSSADKPIGLIDRCTFSGSLQLDGLVPSCSLFVGGITGFPGIYGLMANCVNHGDITVNVQRGQGNAPAYVGGIVGDTVHSAVENCANTGTITVYSQDLPLGCNGIDGGWSETSGTSVGGNNCWSSGMVRGESNVSDPGQRGNPNCYFLEGTNLNAGNSPTFTRAQLTDGTLVNKLNEYVSKSGDLSSIHQLCQEVGMTMRDCQLMAWKQGPNGPELTDSPVVPSTPATTPSTPSGSSTAATGGKPQFTDVNPDAWYGEAVSWAVERNITTGTTNTTFSPNDTCTVAHILTFLWRAKGSPAPNSSGLSNVTDKDWYGKAAQWAKESQLIAGSYFESGEPCTRAMVVTYLWQLAGSPACSGSSFDDVHPNTSYAQAVNWAVEHGITSGTSTTTFSPGDTCTRGQIATFLYRAAQQGIL